MGLVKVHVFVEGIVQGVGFRYFVEREAIKLGIKGWVRNTYDGRVEIEACGESDKIETFLNSVSRGPSSAVVRDVKVQRYDVDRCEYNDFFIKF